MRRKCLLAAALLFSAVLLQIPYPLISIHIVDQAVSGEASQALPILVALLVGFVLVRSFLALLGDYLTLNIRESIIFDVEKALVARVHRLPMRFFAAQHATYLQSRIMSDARSVEGVLIGSMVSLMVSLVTLAVGIGLILYLRWELAIIVMLCALPYGYLHYYGNEKMRSLAMTMQEKQAQTSARVAESFAAIRMIKGFGREPHQDRRIHGALAGLHDIYLKTNREGIFCSSGTQFLAGLAGALILGFGAYLTLMGRMSVGEVFGIMSVMNFVFSPISGLVSTNLSIQQSASSIQRIYELLAEAEDPFTTGASPNAMGGDIRIRELRFGYDAATPVLKGVNLDIGEGEKVALVGKTGEGKSTLMQLLVRFEEPWSGGVQIGGHSVAGLRLDLLRSHVGIVDQQVQLFNDSILENVRFGRLDATDAEVHEACRMAHAHEFIVHLQDGYRTRVGERGARLSGGQCQRLALARMFLKNPKILILDEAVSAVDSESESAIQKSLAVLMKGRTTIIVAHRLSSLLAADRVVVLEAGVIVEQGSHRELLKRQGPYARLFHQQYEIQHAISPTQALAG
ncbi:ABC transporter ATP-binding protein [Sulfidibacter corallicola]|uniref:ABC transporter ATP-binding protein n=1 Tax=Sulfidibacter corallicola TaxID=2818388 RepID=A0A8A4TSP6_SULCO|nr:ABC transporter ATP-binding protein [Sulfidibacter corallicola]QTD52570.1 ABC transporter ATP-binding protein [Sulfidibacter corallicola]